MNDSLLLIEKIETRLSDLLQVRKSDMHTALGVSKTSWFEYKKGIRPVPEYVTCSIQAHLALPDMDLEELVQVRLEPTPLQVSLAAQHDDIDPLD